MFYIHLKKVIRFIQIYGVRKTFFKVLGRTLKPFPFFVFFRPNVVRNVGVIGCGQFSFSTVGSVLTGIFGNIFIDCFDVNKDKQMSFSNFYRIKKSSNTSQDLINNPNVEYIYITSNHASHTDYAVSSIFAGKVVYIEKPICVSWSQFQCLITAIEKRDNPVYFGYNRPFSKAVRQLKEFTDKSCSPVTLSCFITGHMMSKNHWYRNPNEGTRICGNVGHWLDLAVHVLSWGKLQNNWALNISYSDMDNPDDDISISMTSSNGDLINIILTSRCEPFEGINETINFQKSNTICKIDDFRNMTIWQEDKLIKKRYWPKDVGHNLSILQPFQNKFSRDHNEVFYSTFLMLHISNMVKNKENHSLFSFEHYKNKFGLL